jgi:predicted alpha/beta superfamily hydrolase
MNSRADLGALLTFIIFSILAAMMAGCDSPPSDAVRFEVDLSQLITNGDFYPGADSVGIRGAVRPLSWARSIAMKDPNGDGIYSVEIRFADTAKGKTLDYKFKISGQHDRWESGRNRALVLNGSSRTLNRVFDEPVEELPASLTGDVRFHRDFTSKFLSLDRTIQVYLPPGYDQEENSLRQYPVLYMHDGQNIFDQRSAGAEWNMDEYAEDLIRNNQIEPVIIVGISNTDNRTIEYTPPKNDGAALGGEGGGAVHDNGDAYGRFLVEELLPFINRQYRTLTGPGNTALGGSSLGGLISMYFGLAYPDVFGALLVVSPAVWWNDSQILQIVESMEEPTFQRIWLDMGSDEGDNMLTGARQLKDLLVRNGWEEGENLSYMEAEGATHSERAWSARAESMLRFLYASHGAQDS